ncbi:MAG TPA: PfkB family carbohydrate kinase [archaeon]|nr:PfkB family carbohydrate kinase [archaeon]
MPKIVIVGSIALDDVKTPFGEVSNALGGSAIYASLACSLFEKPGVVGVIGNNFPKEHLDLLSSKGIDINGIEKRANQKSFFWKGSYGLDLNVAKTIRTELNVLKDYEPKLPKEYREADFLFLGNIDPDQQLNVLSQMKRRPSFVLADTMNLWIDAKRDKVLEVVKKADLVLLNDGEARQLFRTNSLVKAAREILNRHSKMAVIKKGEHGCIMFTNAKHFSCPGYPLENVLDPTGSGDSFGGALIGYLAKTNNFSEANMRKGIVYASCVASFNAEGFSVEKLKRIALKDVESRYREFAEIVRF